MSSSTKKSAIAVRKKSSHLPFYRKKWFLVTVGSGLGIILAVIIAFKVSPWPGALVIRVVFNRGGSQTLAAMQEKLPDYPVTVLRDQAYKKDDTAAKLDVYMPRTLADSDQNLPLVIWTHGGAWLSGDKKDAAPYYERLADQGFVVVSLNYSLAPNKTYPTAVHQLNDAYSYLLDQARRFHINPDKIFLAGDSAGSQLSSQMATIITNSDYAKEVGVHPNLYPSQLAGIVLYCGIYKMEGLVHPDDTLPKIVGWGDDVAVWAYSGKRDFQDNPAIREMSPYYHVTKDFPAVFVSGGNADPLTDAQSKPLANKLTALGVNVTSLFYDKNHQPALPHEYQFTFNSDGEQAFAKMAEFLKAKARTE